MSKYANPHCGQHPVFGRFQHLYSGALQWSEGFHCKVCGEGVGTVGGGELFALKHWNNRHPVETPVACEMQFSFPVMGGTYEGSMYCVGLGDGCIVHPVTGETLAAEYTRHEYISSDLTPYIRLASLGVMKTRKFIPLLQAFSRDWDDIAWSQKPGFM